MIKNVSSLLNILLSRDRMDDSASRICGALKFLGRADDALRLKQVYESTTFKHLSTANPFSKQEPFLLPSKEQNPYSLRLQSLWRKYSDIIKSMDIELDKQKSSIDIEKIIKDIQEKYQADAYHSLSIERVL